MVIAEFETAKQGKKAFDDLARWSQKPDKQRSGFSAWRVEAEDGQARIVAAAVLVMSGLSDPIIGRLKRRGGKLRDLPEAQKLEMAAKMLKHLEEGLPIRDSAAWRASLTEGLDVWGLAPSEYLVDALLGEAQRLAQRDMPLRRDRRRVRRAADRAV